MLPVNLCLCIQAVFLYCYPDWPSCPANVIQMAWATWAIWVAIKKYSLSSSLY